MKNASDVIRLDGSLSVETVSIVFDGWNALLGAADGFGYSRRTLSSFTIDVPRLADLLDSVTSDRDPRKAA